MEKKELIERYTDYLITSTSVASCTGLSKVLKEEISHDKFTRLLGGDLMSSKELWQLVKPIVREIETAYLAQTGVCQQRRLHGCTVSGVQ